MDKIIMHIDVNNAFLSWTALELLDKGYKYDIRNSYAVIGGDESKRRGIVLAKSNSCKKLGIKTADTLFEARNKCPSLKVYPPNYYQYQKMSKKLFSLLSEYTPDIEVFSIDECFLDYTPIKNRYKSELDFAYLIKDRIKNELGFTVNVGISYNKLCAKMASDFSKPDKVHTLYKDEIKSKMWPLPIDDLFGVGKKSSLKLKKLGINTIGDLACFDVAKLQIYFKNQAIRLINMANGIDDDLIIRKYSEPKGISNETTLDHDVVSKEEVYKYLFSLSELVGLRLRKQNKYASVIAVVLKDKYFRRKSHQKKLDNATNITSEIYEISKKIYDEMDNKDSIRLIGIRLDGLTTNTFHQISMFENLDDRDKDSGLDKVVDEINSKYGSRTIKKAGSIEVNKKPF